MGRLSEDLAKDVGTLKQRFGLTVESECYYPRHFGDAILVLRGQGLAVRFVRDRSQVFLEFSWKDRPWLSCADFLSLIGLVDRDRDQTFDISEAVAILRENENALRPAGAVADLAATEDRPETESQRGSNAT